MKIKSMSMGKRVRRVALAGAIFAGIWAGDGVAARGQTAPADFSPGLQQVVNLAKAGMSDEFIQTYISNAGRSYNLSVDDIIYLHQQGVSDTVIKTLMQPPTATGAGAAPASPAPATPPVAASPAPVAAAAPPAPVAPPAEASPVAAVPDAGETTAPPTLDYFQSQLAPYGSWINVAGIGQCWQPAVAPGWRPYCDGGHWVYTDSGWFWQSDYLWGGIVFHYGRWTYTTAGWVWVPGYDYAPAWVVWRHADADGYVGWAPLPPGAVFVAGGWRYHGISVGLDFDFGLGSTFFTFVDYNHFCALDFHPYLLRGDRLGYAFRRSVFENRFAYDYGRFINQGLDRERVAAFAHQDIRIERAQDLRRVEDQRRDPLLNHYPAGGNRYDTGRPAGQQGGSGQSPNSGRGGGPGQNQWR